MQEVNYYSAFVFFGGPALVLFIITLIGFIIDEKKKTVK